MADFMARFTRRFGVEAHASAPAPSDTATFRGGIHPPDKKELAEDREIVDFPLPDRVAVALSQHIGAPCAPTVQVGQRVGVGEVVGRPPVQDGKPALGAPVHASLDGTVTRIVDNVVWIERP